METQIKEYINSDNIKHAFILKRLLRESRDYINKFISLSINTDNNENYLVYLKDNTNYKYNNYCFILNCNYPFHPPKLLINNIPYKEFLINGSIKYRELFTKMSGLICLCCNNIMSREKWSPANTLLNIIDEVNLFRTYKRNIVNKIMADKIKNKYLIADIDIESWLF